MVNEHWPLFDLEIRTPTLTLRYLDDELIAELLAVARRGVHDPAVMPFTIPWTDLPSPQMEWEAVRFYARTRAELRPDSWSLQFAVLVDGEVVGACDLMAESFPQLRQFTTGSWLGQEFQGRGIGKEFRQAALALGFDGLGGGTRAHRDVARQRRIEGGHDVARLRVRGTASDTASWCSRRNVGLPHGTGALGDDPT